MSAAAQRSADAALVLFPGALGDFICCLPTLRALHAHHGGRMLLVAKPELLEIVACSSVARASIDRREVADLFATGNLSRHSEALFGGFASTYSWTGFGNHAFAARLQRACGGNVHVYPFRGMRLGEHAVDYYARCVELKPATLVASDIVGDQRWLAAFERDRGLVGQALFVMHPGSGSPKKNWQGFDALAAYWRQRHEETIVVLGGPAERDTPTICPDGGVHVDALSLPQVAALLRRATLYLGNDSGISHLAGAVGARGVAVFGPSDPAIWAPRSSTIVTVHAPAPCPGCAADAFCIHQLPVERVIRALEAIPETVSRVVAVRRLAPDDGRLRY